MDILVCIKQVPASNKVEVDPVTGVLLRNGADSKMNPYDLYALETALQIREKTGGTISVISMGPPQAMAVIREAFAMGADKGALLSDRRFGGADVLATSYTLAQGIRKMGTFDLILCGKQTTDGDTAQVGSEVSEWLNIPSVSNVKKIKDIDSNGITIEMDLPNELEIAKVSYPCLLSVDKDIFQPRLPSYVKKTETKDREIEVYSLDDMEDTDETHYGLNGSPTQVKRIFPPETNDHREVWNENSDVIADKLFHMISELKFI
ncbi:MULTISPECIES: electron transfer flavoprotein subunit beta/FixA family protein [Anaerostipes]|uniref:electron transfer flavoprotein subunit beta/FixA family protein n=1 Tax=Anaerostipes TaxID=207244 RepID=UPI00095266A1|nr:MULTISPECIES: electron transfer flavoprotein subunit beta/FixA family protein [Anaerostipes]MCI5624096.1 electron transfer flavoprotein subunit beta/FixA family protein [Anaerostipes sp.]MDY2725847.1 electron transfer flavoprotein subunit beta/FixA family protein [Anaerostipes faecalis]OLR58179.1 electron transfer flavoprotein subunit beta [Anaerostipes sp. 494a]